MVARSPPAACAAAVCGTRAPEATVGAPGETRRERETRREGDPSERAVELNRPGRGQLPFVELSPSLSLSSSYSVGGLNRRFNPDTRLARNNAVEAKNHRKIVLF